MRFQEHECIDKRVKLMNLCFLQDYEYEYTIDLYIWDAFWIF